MKKILDNKQKRQIVSSVGSPRKGTIDFGGQTLGQVVKNNLVNKANSVGTGNVILDYGLGALSTGADLLGNVGLGVLSSFEGIDDLRRNRIADLQDIAGYHKAAEKTRRQAEENWSAPVIGSIGKELQEATEGVHEYSYAGKIPTATAQGIGTSILAMGTAGLGQAGAYALGVRGVSGLNAAGSVVSLGGMGIGSAGSNETQARMELRQQYPELSDEEINKRARNYGLITGTGEVLSEMMFGGISKASNTLGIGTGVFDSFDDAIATKLSANIDNKIIRTLVQSGVKASGEGVEEIVSGLFDVAGKKLALMDERDIWELIQDENLLESFITGTLSAAITQAPGVISNVNNATKGMYRDYVTGLSENEQTVLDAVVESRSEGKDLTKKELSNLRNEVKEALESGRLTSKEINQSLKEQVQGSPADVYLHNISRNENTKFELSDEELKNLKTENQKRLYQEMDRPNNSVLNHDIFNVVNTVQGINDSVKYHLTTTEGLYQKGMIDKNAKGEYTLNGKKYIPRGVTVDGNNIYINVDTGVKSGTQAMYHEMLEAFKSNSPNEYSQFKQMVKDIVGEEAIQKEVSQYQKMYSTEENVKQENAQELTDSVEDEIINDKFGELAENEDFLSRLTENRTMFQRFIDTVKKFIKYMTGTQEEKNLIKMKDNLEKAFKEKYKGTQFKSTKGTNYSLANDYEFYQKELNDKLEQAKGISEEFYNTIKQQMEEYHERHPLEAKIFKDTKSRPATNKNINSEFFKEHQSDYDGKSGTKTPDGIITSLHLQKGDNLAKLTYTEGQDKIWIDELYVKNQKQGYGSEIVNSIKQYAEENGKTVEAFKELESAKGFWDKTLRGDTKYSLTDNQGRELSEQQQEYFKDSKVRDENGNLIEVYHGTNHPGFTEFKASQGDSQFGKYKFGDVDVNYFTASQETARGYTDIGVEENGNVYKTYLNITNPYTVQNSSTSEIKSWKNIKDNNIRQYETEYYDNFENKWNREKSITNNLDEINEDLFPFNCELRLNDGYYELYNLGRNDGMGEQFLLYVNENSTTNELFEEGIKENIYGENFDDYIYSSDNIVKWILTQNKNGQDYDGIIIPDILDTGIRGNMFGEPTTDYITFNSNQIKNVDNLNPTSNPDIRYSLTVQEANTGTDNEGNKLTKDQKNYFKESKITDENGNLITVYHTTTDEIAQFNEFNPVGTPYYHFGDQVVNYYTDSKDMSGSYAGQKYKMADTKRLNNVKEAQEYLNQITDETGNLYNLYQDSKGKWNLSQDKRLSKEARDFLNSLSEEERQEMKEKIYHDYNMEIYDPDYSKSFKWNQFSKELQNKYKELIDKYLGSTDVVELQKEMINYLENPSDLKFSTEEQGRGIGYYDTEEQMLKNIKHDIQDTNMSKKSKIQYEGYLNITNPYIVDAEGRNWNQVVQQSNDFIDDLDTRVSQETKDKLMRLYQESQEISAEARDVYNQVDNLIENLKTSYFSSEVDKDIRKLNKIIGFVGYDEIRQYIETGESPGSSFWYNIADSLAANDVISEKAKDYIIDDFVLPKHINEWLSETYNKQFDLNKVGSYDETKKARVQLGNTISLKELYDKRSELYDQYDKYRYEDAYFKEKVTEDNSEYFDSELEDIFEGRAEMMGAESVLGEIGEAAKNGFSKSQLIRTWGTSKATNDIVKEIIASNKEGTTNYDGIIFQNVVDYGGKAGDETRPNNVYVTFNSNQFKAADNTTPTTDQDIRYSLTSMEDSELDEITQQQYDYFKNTKAVNQDGELETVYHGTPAEFNVFDIEKAGKTGLVFGNGFYFTNSRGTARGFTEGGLYGDTDDQIKTGYVNIEKPASRDTKTISYNEFKQLYDALNNNPNMFMDDMEMSGIDALLSDYGDIYNDKEGTIKTFFDSYNTDVDLIDNLSYMYNPTEFYKTLRDVTGYDGIIVENPSGYDAFEKYFIAFNPDQFKLKDNKTPTNNVDMRLSLTRADQITPMDVAPYNNLQFGNQVQEAIAPLQEQVQQLTDTINELKENIAPISEEEAVNLSRESVNDTAPIRNNLTAEESQELDYLENMSKKFPLRGENLEKMESLRAKELNNPETEISPTRDLNDIRDYDEVGNRNVNAYQYEHPEVKPYFQEEARRMLADLNNSVKAEKFAIGDTRNSTNWDWVGIKRQTSPEIASLLDGDRGYAYSYDDIRKGLNAIIEDQGSENIAVAKRIEFYLDERLRNGYTTVEGYEIAPNQEYNNMLREQEWTNYYEQAPAIKEPTINKHNDLSDLEIDYTPFESMISGLAENKNIREQQAQKVDTKQTNKITKPKNSNGTWNFLKRALVNEFATVDDFAKTHNAPQIKYLADSWNNTSPIAQSNIENVQTDFNGKEIGRSWNSIWKVAEKNGLTEALNDYLIQWSNLDRQRRGKGTDVSYEQSKKLIEKYDAAYPELKPLAKDTWQYFRNFRHGMRDTGYISAETSNVLGHSDPHYIPFISDGVEGYITDSKEIKPRRTIKRAKGGAEQGMLLPVQEAGKRYTYSVYNTVYGNNLFRGIIKASNDVVQVGGDTRNNYVDMADNMFQDENGYYITAYENGEPITARISEDMYKTLSRQMNNTVKDVEQKLSFVTKPLQKLSRIRRDILTKWSPTFPVKNALKDIQDAGFNSKYTVDFAKEYANPKNLYDLATNKGDAQQFRSLYGGGLEMGMFDVDSGLYNPKKGAKNLNFLKWLENANELIELAPRYAEFKASLKNGATIQEAMYNAREVTTNFSRGGVITKALNRNGFTFLNASVQGFDKFIRNFSGENGAKGIVNSLAKATILGVAPAIFNELVFGWGGDKDEDYDALPDYVKDNYYLIKLENGEFLRIPKGRMLSVFGSAARRTLETAQGEENAFQGYLKNVNNQIGINNPEENNIFAPLIQAFGSENGNAWYGGDIVPTRLQNKPTGEQYDESTDAFSIWLGEKTGISPYKINYVLDQYTGGVGDLVLPMFTEEANSEADNVLEYIASGIKDQFVVDSTYDNKYVSEFYSKRDELTVKANGSKATDEDVLQRKYLDNISSQMTELYKEKREVQSNPDLSKKEKYERATEIKKEINRLAKEGLDNYKNVSKDGDYAEVGDNSYQKTEDGWRKVKGEKTEEMNSLGLNSKEKSQYTKTQTQINEIKEKYKGSSSSADYNNKKTDIINTITTSKLNDEAKVQLYKENYSDNMVDTYVTDMGMPVDEYLNYKKQVFTADKYANGKSINGSKKQKVFDYINSMKIPYEQKLILAKEQYNNWNDGNVEIINYLNNNKNLDYQTTEDILKHLGFNVDSNGNISW